MLSSVSSLHNKNADNCCTLIKKIIKSYYINVAVNVARSQNEIDVREDQSHKRLTSINIKIGINIISRIESFCSFQTSELSQTKDGCHPPPPPHPFNPVQLNIPQRPCNPHPLLPTGTLPPVWFNITCKRKTHLSFYVQLQYPYKWNSFLSRLFFIALLPRKLRRFLIPGLPMAYIFSTLKTDRPSTHFLPDLSPSGRRHSITDTWPPWLAKPHLLH